MVFFGTVLDNNDGSGILKVKCVCVLKKSYFRAGCVGDFIVVVVKRRKVIVHKSLQNQVITLGLIVSVNYNVYRKDGSFVRFFCNKVILVDSKFVFISKRVLKPVSFDLFKYGKFNRIFRIAPCVF
jgi:ribosomal protein L14